MNIPTNTLLIFLGAILTFLSTWGVESLKNKREREEKSQNFKLLVKQELLAISKGLEKLKTLVTVRDWFDMLVLGQLEKNIANLDNYRKEAVYLPTTELQEIFIDLSSDISTFVVDTRGLQQYYWDESKRIQDNAKGSARKTSVSRSGETIDTTKKGASAMENLVDYFNKRKTEKTIELIEIKRRIDDFLKQITI